MTVRRIPLADWLHHRRADVAQLGCRTVGGLTVNRAYLFSREVEARANRSAAHLEQSQGRTVVKVAQPNWEALGLGSADEAEGRN